MNRRSFIKKACMLGVAALVPYKAFEVIAEKLPKKEKKLKIRLPKKDFGKSALMTPSMVTKEALKILNDNLVFTRAMQRKR